MLDRPWRLSPASSPDDRTWSRVDVAKWRSPKFTRAMYVRRTAGFAATSGWVTKCRVSPKSIGRSAELSHDRRSSPSVLCSRVDLYVRGYVSTGTGHRSLAPFRSLVSRWTRAERAAIRVTNTPDRLVARVPRATLSTRSSIFKDGLRWVSAGPWSPAERSSPSRKSAGCSRRRSSRRRCTESATSSDSCRSSRGLSSPAVRPGRSVFALAPAEWSCCHAVIDSTRLDYCCAALSLRFPAKTNERVLLSISAHDTWLRKHYFRWSYAGSIKTNNLITTKMLSIKLSLLRPNQINYSSWTINCSGWI